MTKNPMEIFKDFELDIDHGTIKKSEPPFLVYRGKGSSNFNAEDKVYYSVYDYTIEYYFIYKDEDMEKAIEERFDSENIMWDKSSDIFIEEENMFVIYYNI